MDKDWKLQRYNRKDYSELVEFPVEIVGRDGVVRRYTFEDSIRLYQRRITFAPIRYRDNELIRAEVHHCRSRIDQLRRSYFHRFGWGTPDGEVDAEEVFGELAGELAAFVCRVLHCEGRPEIRFEQLKAEAEGVSTWFITPKAANSGMLLYVHRFHGDQADRVREGFFASLKSLERMGRCEGDGERLLAFHHTVDCGFVLTGRGGEFNALMATRADEESSDAPGVVSVDLTPTPWDEVLELIRRGEHEVALRRCRAMVADQPWHRNAYIAGAMLASYLQEPGTAEELALVGCGYFPDEATLRYYLGVSRISQGRAEEGEEALSRALQLDPSLVAARTALVIAQLKAGAYTAALRLLRERPEANREDRRADAALEMLESWLTWRRTILVLGLTLALLGVAALPFSWVAVVPTMAGVIALALGHLAFQRQVDGLVNRQRHDEVRRGLRHLARARPSDALIS